MGIDAQEIRKDLSDAHQILVLLIILKQETAKTAKQKMDTLAPRLFHVSQVCLSAYSLYISYVTIPKLRKNEDIANKAAKWSNYAARQLHKVKTTEASGALTVITFVFEQTLLQYD